ncbi:MAG TPA: transporter substrate-binding domain-containing protein [Myxococcota bacterium]|jgi:polar amino acid transport system substrate-binding protein|nr:transporter substrate-binding domain-containing protein [Myxococcota bacterium]
MKSAGLSSGVLTMVLGLAAACGGSSTTATPGTGAASGAPATGTGAEGGGGGGGSAAGTAADLLSDVKARGELHVSTDPNYAPQSFLKPDGTYEGFDIDVATEIAKRLGVKVVFEPVGFEAVAMGGWGGKWDVGVSSVTVTDERKKLLDFTVPYYFTPAQLVATKEPFPTSIDGFAGKRICVGAATTYLDWLNGKLVLAGVAPPPPPKGVVAIARDTDQSCADAVKSGKADFDGWLSAAPTVASAAADAAKAGVKIAAVGAPVFAEPLGIVLDRAGPPHALLQAELDRLVQAMKADGTLSAFSTKWFAGLDLTKP